jgi:hypothetical protein
MSNPAKGKFSGPGEGNVYAKANEVIVKITGADTNQTFEVVEENCKPGFQSRAHYHTPRHMRRSMSSTEVRSFAWVRNSFTVEKEHACTFHPAFRTRSHQRTASGC